MTRSFFPSRSSFLNVLAMVCLLAITFARGTFAQTPGTVDPSFDPGTGPSYTVDAVALVGEGKIFIRGRFGSVNGVNRYYFARLNVDGTLDASFDPGQSDNQGYNVNSMAVQSDGKIVIGGNFTRFDNNIREYVARLNADGSLDTTFKTNSGANDAVNDLALQSDGKVIIGGNFYQFQGENRQAIARLNTDGTLDESFDPGDGPDGQVIFVRVQSDGKIIIAGNFANVAGTARNHLARLNADGSLDASFDPGVYKDGSLAALALQTDGKILIGGQFTMVDGAARANIARLNADGSLDASFDPGVGPNDVIATLAAQQDGKVVIGGAFTEIGNTARNRIAQLNADGSLDTSFKPGSGPNGEVDAVAVQADGRIVIGGGFTIINGETHNYIARLYGEPVPVITSATTATATVSTAFSYQIAATNNPTSFGVLGLPKGFTVNRTSGVISGTPTAAGTYKLTLRVASAAGAATGTLTLTVKLPAPVITSADAATATAGKMFSYQIKATNSPTSYGVLGLPPGLSVNAKTGLISGAPTVSGTRMLTLRATNAGGTGTAKLTLTIKEGIPGITSAATDTATVGKPFTYQITATNHPTSYSVGGLTDGLSLNKSTGVISGTPKTAQTLSLTLRATNDSGTGSASLTLTIESS